MKSKTIVLTEDECNGLVSLIDVAVKSLGLQCAQGAVFLLSKIQAVQFTESVERFDGAENKSKAKKEHKK